MAKAKHIIENASPLVSQNRKKLSLRLVLIVPFVLQIFAAVGLTGYLSLRNGQKAVNDLATQLQDKVSDQVSAHLDEYLATPHEINQINLQAIKLNLIDLNDIYGLGRYFQEQMKVFTDFGYINFANEKGEFIGINRVDENELELDIIEKSHLGTYYKYAIDNKGNTTNLIAKYEYNYQQESWYKDAVKAGKPLWTRIYNWASKPKIIAISASYPVYDSANNLIGVLGIDHVLSRVNKFLHQLEVSPSAKTFILERNTLLVATSSLEPSYTIVDGEARRLSVNESSDSLIQATAAFLQEKFGDLSTIDSSQQLKFKIDGNRHFVQVTPWQDEFGLDWLVVVTVPESDFMAQINANNRTTILLCLAALAIATLLGIYTSRRISEPILRISQATQAISSGNLEQKVSAPNVNELGILAQSFNQMAHQLRESFAALEKTNQELEKTNESLEIRVEERTKELQQAKEVADTANQAKSEFLANMSHELRTPLNAILGFTQIMQRDSSLEAKQQENLGIISRSGEHLLSLIGDVLDMSKIEAGRISLNENNFDLSRLLYTLEDMLALKAEAKNLSLIVERSEKVPQYIKTDESKLRQVLINLIGNAIKFTEQGGVTLRVGLKNSPHTLLFEVEDSGAGIAPDEIDTLFDAFVQTATGRKSQEGTGLGLPISRRFVQLMGGDVTVKSTVGQGTVFTFTIQFSPASQADIKEAQTTGKITGLEANQPKYKILAVDDRWENRQLLLKLLTPLGFEVKEAENGKKAIEIWQSWQPDLIFMDMRMPILDGYEATKRIKATTQGQATVIIALTASAFEEERSIVLSAGCDDFLRKPFQEMVLLKAISKHLGVRYIYAANSLPSNSETEIESYELSTESLSIMPLEWKEKLQQAAAEADEELTIELIEEIPESSTAIANALRKLVDEFLFEEILELTQPHAMVL